MELTFEVLCGLEPQLKKLYDEIRNRPREKWHCVVSIWSYSDYKERMKHLVGRFRKNTDGDRRLWSSKAYDLAYEALMGALGECRPVECWCGDDDLKAERDLELLAEGE